MENIYFYILAFGCGIISALVYLINFSCKHNFDLVDTIQKTDDWGSHSLVYVSRCSKCGKIASKEVK